MQIGFCGKPEMMEEVKASGFDYLELPMSHIAGLSNAEFEEVLARVKAAALPTPSFNVFLPGTLMLLEGDSAKALDDYLAVAMDRAKRLEGKVIVFGSGKSRTRPADMTYDEAFRKLAKIARRMGEAAEKFGIDIVIEPLNRAESNMINSVAEGAALAAMANHPHVKLLADYFHVTEENEPLEDIVRVSGIAHAHIATRAGRLVPTEPEDGFRQMFAAMKRTGYSGRISIEGKTENLAADGPRAVQVLKKIWEEA